MFGLTHTREVRDFLLACVILLCVSAPSLTDEVYARLAWFRRAGGSYALLYLAAILTLGGCGWLMVGIRLLPSAPGPLSFWLITAASAAGGVLLGFLTARADRAVARAGRLRQRGGHGWFAAGGQAQPDAKSAASLSLSQLLAVAGAEEIIYRGVLPRACFALPRAAVPVGLALTAALFPLCHARFGWRQVVAKTPLSVAALACVLVSHSLLPALTAHGAFNVDMWRERRRRFDSRPVGLGDPYRSVAAPWRFP